MSLPEPVLLYCCAVQRQPSFILMTTKRRSTVRTAGVYHSISESESVPLATTSLAIGCQV